MNIENPPPIEQLVLTLKEYYLKVGPSKKDKENTDLLFKEISQQLIGLIYNHIHSGSLHRFEKDDLYQEALITLISAIKKFNPDISPFFKSFYSLLLKNRLAALAHSNFSLKRGMGQFDIPFELAHSIFEESGNYAAADYVRSPVATPEEYVLARNSFDKFITTLTPTESEYMGEYLKQKEDKEIAADLKISYGRMNNSKRRTIKKLTTYIKDG